MHTQNILNKLINNTNIRYIMECFGNILINCA